MPERRKKYSLLERWQQDDGQAFEVLRFRHKNKATGANMSKDIQKYMWSGLNKQQVGAYTEYFVMMELTMYGFQVYKTEVDDRGIDFVARHANGPFIEVQVKSVRPHPSGYVFMQKEKFVLQDSLFLALGLLFDGRMPELYLVPSIVWKEPNDVFVSRDFKGLESKPEWGLNISNNAMSVLEPYRFDRAVSKLLV